MKYPAALVAAVVACLSLSNCGDGGSDDNPATIRPKSLDGTILRLDSGAQFEFFRYAGVPNAIHSGDVESGTFIYTPLTTSVDVKFYDNLTGDKSNFRYPDAVAFAEYEYRAINESSGVLTLRGSGQFGIFIDLGDNIVLNGSRIDLFRSASPGGSVFGLGEPTNEVEVGIGFTSNSGFVTTDTVTLRLPESEFVSTLDTVRIPSSFRLASGGPVPENYGSEIDPNAPGKIVPATLSNTLLSATNGIPDVTKDFSLQFTADASGVNGLPGEPEEIGHAILSVWEAGDPPFVLEDPDLPESPDNPLVPNGVLRAMSVAADYTWRRIGGTDTGVLVLSNIPDEAGLDFDVSLNGTYLVDFSGFQTGLYTGSVDADTLDAGHVSGSFTLLNE